MNPAVDGALVPTDVRDGWRPTDPPAPAQVHVLVDLKLRQSEQTFTTLTTLPPAALGPAVTRRRSHVVERTNAGAPQHQRLDSVGAEAGLASFGDWRPNPKLSLALLSRHL
jgi:hypothetical protein